MVVNDRIAELIRESRADEITAAITRRRLLRHADPHPGAARADDRRARRPRDRDERGTERPRLPDRARPCREGAAPPRPPSRQRPRPSRPRGRRGRRRTGVRCSATGQLPTARHEITSRRRSPGAASLERAMTGAVAALAFVPGLAVGSFLNVVAARVPARLSIVAPRSCCPACSTEIAWYDNIPIVSYLAPARPLPHAAAPGSRSSTRSSSSRRRRSSRPASSTSASPPAAAISAFFCAALVVITVTDLERRVIPNRVVLPAAAFVLAARTLGRPLARLGDRGARPARSSCSSPRSPTRAGSGWATSSSRSCSVPRSARHSPSR